METRNAIIRQTAGIMMLKSNSKCQDYPIRFMTHRTTPLPPRATVYRKPKSVTNWTSFHTQIMLR